MKRTRLFLLCALVVVAAVILIALWPKSIDKHTIRLGWQPPWANQGQIVQVLKRNAEQQSKLDLSFVAFSYGGPMVEAARAGELDVLFVGDQPAITLLSRDTSWRVIARMTNYRSAIIVPHDSPLNTLSDLRGKRVVTAYGSTTHRDVVRIFEENSLSSEDITLVNIDQAQHGALTNTWSDFDAIATYDPTIEIAIRSGRARILYEWVSPAVVIARNHFILNNETQMKAFVEMYAEAFFEYSQTPEEFNQLYNNEAKMDLPDDAFAIMARPEPNLSVQNISEVSIGMNEVQIDQFQKNADIALRLGLIKTPVDVRKYLNLHFVK